MQSLNARQLVVKAGLALVESGLIARTWGNVSCRVDQDTFAVTPSGRAYETLTTEEVVLCRTADCSYEGDIKPSSEKRLHALIYQIYPEMNFVIHTHQKYASVISAMNLEEMPCQGYDRLGEGVPIAAYGLPGTKKLKQGVEAALKRNKGHAVIMAHHGALCYGESYDEAFLTARQLEEACERYLQENYLMKSGEKVYDPLRRYEFYISQVTGKKIQMPEEVPEYYSSFRTPEGFVLEGKEEKSYYFTDPMPEEARIHSLIYQKRSDIHFITQDKDPALVALSYSGQELKPYLDDFAQIVGVDVRCSKELSPEACVRALKGRLGVLIPGAGALCCAANKSDLQAVCIVMEKNAHTKVGTGISRGAKTISRPECLLMHLVYQKSYSKKSK